ncbi:MAG: acyl-CoA dehydrogenase family protein, partial [Acidimicrobiales bacterium]
MDPSVDLDQAAAAVDCADVVVRRGVAALRESGVDAAQVVAYDVAHAAASVATARAAVAYGGLGDVEARIACAFVADVVSDLRSKISGREASWKAGGELLDPADKLVAAHRDPEVLAALCGEEGPRHLPEDLELARETFHRFADNEVRPHAEHVHRTNSDIPETIISGLAALGGFGLSVPEEYGGFASGGENDVMGMVVATEELSWGSLGIGGSLITRPEILSRALVCGGTDEQKRRWLPELASGELLAAVAVTEPDYGSDVAGIATTAAREGGGWVVNGVKTWCTFAARADLLMLLARTDPDRSKGHRGLSLFVVDKGPATG